MMLICMYLLSTKLDFPKKIEQFSKALLEISMMMLFSETSRFSILLIMYYLCFTTCLLAPATYSLRITIYYLLFDMNC